MKNTYTEPTRRQVSSNLLDARYMYKENTLHTRQMCFGFVCMRFTQEAKCSWFCSSPPYINQKEKQSYSSVHHKACVSSHAIIFQEARTFVLNTSYCYYGAHTTYSVTLVSVEYLWLALLLVQQGRSVSLKFATHIDNGC